MSLDSDLANSANSVLGGPGSKKGELYRTQEEKDKIIRELKSELDKTLQEITQNKTDIEYMEILIKELKKKNGGNFASSLWKGMRITAGATAIVTGTAMPLHDTTLVHAGNSEGTPKEIGITPQAPADTLAQNPNDTLTWNTDPINAGPDSTEEIPAVPVNPVQKQPGIPTKPGIKLDTVAVPTYVPPKVKLVKKDTLTNEQKYGPKNLQTGVGTAPNTPATMKRGRIQSDTLPGTVPSSGTKGPWKKPAPTEKNTTPNKATERKVIPVYPGHPYPEIIDERIIPGGIETFDDDDDTDQAENIPSPQKAPASQIKADTVRTAPTLTEQEKRKKPETKKKGGRGTKK